MSHLSSDVWLVAVPDEQENPKGIVDRFVAEQNSRGATYADVFIFDVPWRSLKVGTLDSLMALSDDLAKVDTFCEGVVRRVQRQVEESSLAHAIAQAKERGELKADGTPVPGAPPFVHVPPMLKVGGRPVMDYLRKWSWDGEQFDPSRESLPDLVRRLAASAEKVDADMRAIGAAYGEKKAALQALERKRGGNLMVGSLDEVLTPAALETAGAEWLPADHEYLASLAIVVPKASEEAFLAEYASLDGQAVPVGPAGRREAQRGSPAVPGSARKIAEDKDGYVLFVIAILKKFADSYRAAAREKRFIVRDHTYEPGAAAAAAAEASRLDVSMDGALAQLAEMSRIKFGEAMLAWVHVKAITLFVGSVLRFGLPVKFSAALWNVRGAAGAAGAGGGSGSLTSNAKRALECLQAAWKKLPSSLAQSRAGAGASALGAADDGVVETMIIPGVSDGSASTAHFPFVLSDMKVEAAVAGKA